MSKKPLPVEKDIHKQERYLQCLKTELGFNHLGHGGEDGLSQEEFGKKQTVKI